MRPTFLVNQQLECENSFQEKKSTFIGMNSGNEFISKEFDKLFRYFLRNDILVYFSECI